VRELSVAVVLAPAITSPDDAESAPFAPPVRSPMASPPSPWPEIAVWGPPPEPPAGQGARLDRP
jgi:hypothetical protein